MEFPALSQAPALKSYQKTKAADPTIRSPKEAGYVGTRPRFTRIPNKWTIGYRNMSAADKELLEAHQDAVRVGAGIFTWTDPVDGASYNVRLAAPIKFTPGVRQIYWNADLELEEA